MDPFRRESTPSGIRSPPPPPPALEPVPPCALGSSVSHVGREGVLMEAAPCCPTHLAGEGRAAFPFPFQSSATGGKSVQFHTDAYVVSQPHLLPML